MGLLFALLVGQVVGNIFLVVFYKLKGEPYPRNLFAPTNVLTGAILLAMWAGSVMF